MFTLTLLKNRLVQFALVGTIGLGAGVLIHRHFAPPVTTTTIVHDTQEVKVEVPVLTTKVVDRIVADPKQQIVINSLLKENNALKVKVTQLSSTTATSTTTGGGTPTVETPTPVTQPTNDQGGQPQVPPSQPTQYSFKDYQLDAHYTTSTFNYALTQSFRVVSTVGKDKDGHQVGLVKLFQDTPKGAIEIPSKTTVIFADPTLSHWLLSPRIQAGLGFDQDKQRGGAIVFQWLKRGKSPAAEDVAVAIFSPGLFVTGNTVTPVILPVSYNIGTIPHIPFLTNVWISPMVDKAKRVGVVFTATF